ncbi:hypothetical protein [Fibrobacter sp. UWH1]|nr:hypothetical protein [Fibrobacter sp. UWH1]
MAHSFDPYKMRNYRRNEIAQFKLAENVKELVRKNLIEDILDSSVTNV